MQVINPNSIAALGIEVVDVRIKQINLPAEVSEAIYNRMRAGVKRLLAIVHRVRKGGKLRDCGLKSPRCWRKPSARPYPAW